MFGDFVDRTYTMEPKIKDTTMYAGNLDLRLEIDNADGQERNSKTEKIISIFQLWTFHL